MIRARVLLALACSLIAACHSASAQKRTDPVDRLPPETLRKAFKDTVVSAFAPSNARDFDLRRPGQRDALRALLKKERALWRSKRPRDYRYVLRVGCFCAGTRGWLLMDVRSSQPLRAWDPKGQPAPLTDWNTLSIDALFDNLQQFIDRVGLVQILFDRGWHFPSYARTVALPGPDSWSIVDARGFRPAPQH
jgi:hypothetical protein